MRTYAVRILIFIAVSSCIHPVWSESLLGAKLILLVLSCGGSFLLWVEYGIWMNQFLMIFLSRLLFRYEFKLLSHGQICTREYLFAYMQICSRVQMWSCERIYSRMQNFLHMQNFTFAPSQDQVQVRLHIYKFYSYANLVMWTQSKICLHTLYHYGV